jgi:hypothetical protein
MFIKITIEELRCSWVVEHLPSMNGPWDQFPARPSQITIEYIGLSNLIELYTKKDTFYFMQIILRFLKNEKVLNEFHNDF